MNKSKYLKKRRLTKRTRKNKIYYGGKDDKNNDKNNDNDDREGIIDIVKNKVVDLSEGVPEYATEKGLRLLGLQSIKSNIANSNEQINKSMSKISDTASGVVSDIQAIGSDLVEIANKTTGSVIENVNEVLSSPQVNKTIMESASDTAAIGENLLRNFNETFNTPGFKEQTKIALDNAAEIATIGIEAMDDPIDRAIDKLNDAGTKAASGFFSGLVKTGTDLAAAVPYVGAVIDFGKALNDGSKAVSSVIEAGSDAAEATSDLIIETTENYKNLIKELEKKKIESMNIASRTTNSIKQFEKPIQNISSIPGISKVPTSGGSAGTRKRLTRKSKSKRVRFYI